MTTKYPACDHIIKPSPGIQISEDIAEAIGRNYRTLPMFQKGLHEVTYKKHYSLEGNEFLKCRWAQFKKNIESRVNAPVFFLNIRDYHFYNCRNQLIPALSIFSKEDYRMKLRPGPGVDFRGQMPIPDDMIMKRGTQKPKPKKPKAAPKDDEEANQKDKASKNLLK